MSNDKKPTGKPRPVVRPDGTVFTAYGVTTRLVEAPKTPNWRGEWNHTPEVELWQASLLSLNLDPHLMKHDRDGWMNGPGGGPFLTDSNFPNKSAKDEYLLRLRVLSKNLSNRDFFSPCTLNMGSPNKCGVLLSEFAVWAVEVVKWPALPPELIALARKQTDAPEQNDATPKQEIDEPFLQRNSRNSRAAVDRWVKWQAQQQVKDADNTSDLAARILEIAGRWEYQSERGPMTIASITKMLPPGLTGGRGKNKGIRGKIHKK